MKPKIIFIVIGIIILTGLAFFFVRQQFPILEKHSPITISDMSASEDNKTQYLLFHLGSNGIAVPSIPNSFQITTKADLEKSIDDIVQKIGQRGDHVHQQLGVMMGPVSFDLSDDQLRTLIDNAFSIAEEKDVAVGFHIDDSMFWNNRKDIWSDKNNVEWSNWSGTIVPHRIIGWVHNGDPILAPPMCFNSPVITAETTRIARDVIGAEIKKGVDHLKTIGKPYLFAGVITGWETRMQDDSNPPVYYGYCALHNLGYSASNPPADLDMALQGVVSDWIALWGKGLQSAGIPRDRIYTHIAYPGVYTDDIARQLKHLYKNPNPTRDFYKGSPPDVAFNSYSIPGFSIYDGDGSIFKGIYPILTAHGSGAWGISEGNAISLAGDNALDGSATRTMEQYLASAYNHGAVYVNIFGWTTDVSQDSPFAKAASGPSAIAAYQKFLSSGTLSE